MIGDLLNNGHDAVVRAAATALRNLAIDPRIKANLGMFDKSNTVHCRCQEGAVELEQCQFLLIYIHFIREMWFVDCSCMNYCSTCILGCLVCYHSTLFFVVKTFAHRKCIKIFIQV